MPIVVSYDPAQAIGDLATNAGNFAGGIEAGNQQLAYQRAAADQQGRRQQLALEAQAQQNTADYHAQSLQQQERLQGQRLGAQGDLDEQRFSERAALMHQHFVEQGMTQAQAQQATMNITGMKLDAMGRWRTDANASRENIAQMNNDTRAGINDATNQNRLDVAGANMAGRAGIATANNASREAIAGMRPQRPGIDPATQQQMKFHEFSVRQLQQQQSAIHQRLSRIDPSDPSAPALVQALQQNQHDIAQHMTAYQQLLQPLIQQPTATANDGQQPTVPPPAAQPSPPQVQSLNPQGDMGFNYPAPEYAPVPQDDGQPQGQAGATPPFGILGNGPAAQPSPAAAAGNPRLIDAQQKVAQLKAQGRLSREEIRTYLLDTYPDLFGGQ